MTNDSSDIWNYDMTRQFAEVLTAMSNTEMTKLFLRDVMTEKEILEMSARFEAAKMLQKGMTYLEVTKKTKLSSRTVARISDWLKKETGGYESAITLSLQHSHIPPAHAE